MTPRALHPVGAETRIRIARPSRSLVDVERFYVQGLGLKVLWRTTGHVPGEHDLLMVGLARTTWHFEFTHDPLQPLDPTPTVDDLFVLYLDIPNVDDLVDHLLTAGGARVAAHNPYWDEYGVTVTDPDGYRLVLCTRAWSPDQG
ncbi:VOC family protein [Streptomyces sp. NPDC001634]|uniref:VOC family protein n=1 Tax=Streptomyces sp. NPDC001634 TaxID=3154390 RepID=UPI003320816A